MRSVTMGSHVHWRTHWSIGRPAKYTTTTPTTLRHFLLKPYGDAHLNHQTTPKGLFPHTPPIEPLLSFPNFVFAATVRHRNGHETLITSSSSSSSHLTFQMKLFNYFHCHRYCISNYQFRRPSFFPSLAHITSLNGSTTILVALDCSILLDTIRAGGFSLFDPV